MKDKLQQTYKMQSWGSNSVVEHLPKVEPEHHKKHKK
jgi:hypothetical protein